jgi:hypothetical protein
MEPRAVAEPTGRAGHWERGRRGWGLTERSLWVRRRWPRHGGTGSRRCSICTQPRPAATSARLCHLWEPAGAAPERRQSRRRHRVKTLAAGGIRSSHQRRRHANQVAWRCKSEEIRSYGGKRWRPGWPELAGVGRRRQRRPGGREREEESKAGYRSVCPIEWIGLV